METELIIEGCGFPPFSARGCQQELSQVEQGAFRRTVNGQLTYLGPKNHKYRSIIRCEDKVTLVTEGVLARGQVVRIGCLQRLWQQVNVEAASGPVTLEREAVAGSVGCLDAFQKSVDVRVVDAKTVEVMMACAAGDVFISYRPWLSMRVISLALHTDEWGLKAGWRLELEEV
ncbi:MAG: hypothetical protein V4482_03930 [Pseudomonadota bacterium]